MFVSSFTHNDLFTCLIIASRCWEQSLSFLLCYLVIWICFLPSPDPYLNTDAGTMSPFEHGEVFVLDDGGEVSFFPPFLGTAYFHS